MKKTELNAQEINDWMYDHWNLYSSEMCNEKLLCLWINGQGCYRVIHGDETLYEGSQMTHAIDAWNKA